MTAYNVTTAACLRGPMPEDCIILDVRTAAEHEECCLACKHIHIPLDRLSEQTLRAEKITPEKPVYILCKLGPRAHAAAQKMVQLGYKNLYVMEGGITQCKTLGLPLRRGKPTMSLERQVRIVAGAFILAGCAIGFFLHPAGYALPALVGAGLVFSGVRDWCGMALLLAKMPWNRKA